MGQNKSNMKNSSLEEETMMKLQQLSPHSTIFASSVQTPLSAHVDNQSQIGEIKSAFQRTPGSTAQTRQGSTIK
jgi:hypothetical protein